MRMDCISTCSMTHPISPQLGTHTKVEEGRGAQRRASGHPSARPLLGVFLTETPASG